MIENKEDIEKIKKIDVSSIGYMGRKMYFCSGNNSEKK